MSNQYIGILVDASLYSLIPSGKTKHEKLTFYEEACLEQGLIPCYFRLQDIHLSTGHVLAYIRSQDGYHRRTLPLPPVIHNRAIHKKKTSLRKLRRITEHGIMLFNARNRYSKLKIHHLLMQNPALRPHLPGTDLATLSNLTWFMGQYDELILKPDSSSIGRGIMMLKRLQSGWRLSYPAGKATRHIVITSAYRLWKLLRKKAPKGRYIVQQKLPLATYTGRPFDLRVSVQKDHTGQWQVTGIAGKYAAKGKYVTNVAQGGSVLQLHALLGEYPLLVQPDTRTNIEQFSLEVARTLESRLDGLSDIGLDVGITDHGYPVFIECNCRDLRYSFKECNMLEEWKATYSNPIGYAKYLLNNRR